MEDQARKAWSRPELIVIVRGQQEEAVLWLCKHNDRAIMGADGSHNNCYTPLVVQDPCGQACSFQVGS